MLIKPSDIGGDLNSPQPPVLNPNGAAGVAQLFANADKVSGAWQPADVGSNGSIISGTSPDKSQAVTVLLFTEGKALVNLEFDSAPNDPIGPGVATDIGRKQDTAVKNGLPS